MLNETKLHDALFCVLYLSVIFGIDPLVVSGVFAAIHGFLAGSPKG